jgi:hypothetical protein
MSLCLIEHHAIKTYWGCGGIAPRILDLGTRWRWVVSFTTRPLYPRERSPGTHLIGSWVGPRAVRKAVVKRKIRSPSRKSNPRTPIVQSVAQRPPSSNAEVTEWVIPPFPNTPSWRSARLKHRDNFTFYLYCSSINRKCRVHKANNSLRAVQEMFGEGWQVEDFD